MAFSADTAKGKARFIANKMRMEAALEGKPNHERHVENMIQYADAVAEAAVQQATVQMRQELPLLIQQELAKEQNRPKIVAQVDEKSVATAKKKIADMIKSIFRG